MEDKIKDRFTIMCEQCKKVAATIGRMPHDGERFALSVTGFIGTMSLYEINHKPVDEKMFDMVRTLGDVSLPALHFLDPDAFGFICKICRKAYCVSCWHDIYDRFDEGFHNDTRGTCPYGHVQMLQD